MGGPALPAPCLPWRLCPNSGQSPYPSLRLGWCGCWVPAGACAVSWVLSGGSSPSVLGQVRVLTGAASTAASHLSVAVPVEPGLMCPVPQWQSCAAKCEPLQSASHTHSCPSLGPTSHQVPVCRRSPTRTVALASTASMCSRACLSTSLFQMGHVVTGMLVGCGRGQALCQSHGPGLQNGSLIHGP